MKIISQLSATQFVIDLEDFDSSKEKVTTIVTVHDYIGIMGKAYVSTTPGLSIQYSNDFSSNSLAIPVYQQIQIKSIKKVILPFLNKEEYLQDEHFKDRIAYEDGKLYKKGDSYPAYSYSDQYIRYYDSQKKIMMVAISLAGEKEFTHVTNEFFNKFVYPNL